MRTVSRLAGVCLLVVLISGLPARAQPQLQPDEAKLAAQAKAAEEAKLAAEAKLAEQVKVMEEAKLAEQTACSTPSFAFKWIGDRSVQLLAKATPAGRYHVWIEESQRSPDRQRPLAVAVNGGELIYAAESDPGQPYTVDLTGMNLLASSGRARIWYVAEKPCLATSRMAIGRVPAGTVALSMRDRLKLIDSSVLQDIRKDWWWPRGGLSEAVAQAQTGAPQGVVPAVFIPTTRPQPQQPQQPQPGNELDLYQTDGVVVLEPHHLSIDIGPVFVMRNDGKFDTEGELALTASSRWTEMLGAAVDLRLSSLNLPASAAGSGAGGAATPPVSLSSSNVFEGTARAIFYPGGVAWSTPSFGLVGGGGVRSRLNRDSTTDPVPLLEANLMAGMRLQVPGYNAGNPADSLAGTQGFIEVGYTRDRYWKDPSVQSDQRNRLYAEGQLEIPGLGGKNVRVLMRVRGSKPMQFDGPSDLRISALAAINPAVFSTIFGLGN